MFPFINNKLIKNTNKQIDSPTIPQMYFNSMMNNHYKTQGLRRNPFDIFSLTQSGGHRKNNHDLLTGMMLGSVEAMKMGLPPSHGMMSVIGHYATDALSNKMVSTMGVPARNMFESLMGMSYRRNNNRYYSRW